ncbi:hypothetical protein LguiA_008256 [Lonicera macranthoides]
MQMVYMANVACDTLVHDHDMPLWSGKINQLIEEAIFEAEARGTKGEELNGNGELYIKRYPELKVKVVDGSSLAVAIVINKIPKGTTQVLLVAEQQSKVASFIASALCQCGIQIWVVGDGLSEEEQMKAPKGTTFIPFSQFPPKKVRKDCLYQYTPSMLAPSSLENLHSCENWLPRRVMSAWRVAGIVNGLEGWNENESGDTIFNIDIVWQATLKHGFQP